MSSYKDNTYIHVHITRFSITTIRNLSSNPIIDNSNLLCFSLLSYYVITRTRKPFWNFSNCSSIMLPKTYQTAKSGSYPFWIRYCHFGLKMYTKLDENEYGQQDQSCQVSKFTLIFYQIVKTAYVV